MVLKLGYLREIDKKNTCKVLKIPEKGGGQLHRSCEKLSIALGSRR